MIDGGMRSLLIAATLASVSNGGGISNETGSSLTLQQD